MPTRRRKKHCRRKHPLVNPSRTQASRVVSALMTVVLVAIATLLGSQKKHNHHCHGFSFSSLSSTEPPSFRERLPRAQKRTTIDASVVTTNTGDAQNESNGNLSQQQQHQHQQQHRREFVSGLLSSAAAAAAGLVVTPGVARAAEDSSGGSIPLPPPPTTTAVAAASTRIVRLSSGLQFSDARVGKGPVLALPTASNEMDTDTDALPEPDDPTVVLLHLRALRRDGSVLLDTYDDGQPLIFRLGSIPSDLYLLDNNNYGALKRGKIPLGVQDAILAPGMASWEGGFGRADPMRSGGIRKVVVPPELAYGSRGVSRYEAYKVGLKQPVAVNELLRYEIEVLRCNDEKLSLGESSQEGEDKTAPTAKACCLEEFYPCQMGGGF